MMEDLLDDVAIPSRRVPNDQPVWAEKLSKGLFLAAGAAVLLDMMFVSKAWIPSYLSLALAVMLVLSAFGTRPCRRAGYYALVFTLVPVVIYGGLNLLMSVGLLFTRNGAASVLDKVFYVLAIAICVVAYLLYVWVTQDEQRKAYGAEVYDTYFAAIAGLLIVPFGMAIAIMSW